MLSKLAVKSKSAPPKSPRKQSKGQSMAQKSKKMSRGPQAEAVDCPPIGKRKKKEAPPKAEAECSKPKLYTSPWEKRTYLEQQAVPILFEGLLAVAREQPRDPIGYLEKFWLKDGHKCDIQLPRNIL